MECEYLYAWSGPEFEWPKRANSCTWQGELTAGQEDASEKIKMAIFQQQEELLIWAVTGAGKTEMLFHGVALALEQGKRVCLATPRADVVRELKPRFEQAFAGTPIAALYGGSKDKHTDAQLILSTTHQLLRFQHAFDVMIIDEIDAFPYHKDPMLVFAANRACKPTNSKIYLTATPRKEQKIKMKNKKLPFHFVPTRYHGHALPVPKMRLSLALIKDLKAKKVPRSFITWFMNRKVPKRQLLIFTPTITMAKELNAVFKEYFLENGFISNKTEITSVHSEDSKREEKVQAFREKKLKIMLTTTILERGVTFPSVDVAILDAGHQVFDEAALVQIAGRAGRSATDPDGEVIFFHEGKTEAMVSAIYMIKDMNKRGGF
ncbi:DEAD/DEAH box helicase [Oceanobacillus sp. CAU 1775]